MSNLAVLHTLRVSLALGAGTLCAQSPGNFLERAFGPSRDQPLLSALAPGFNLTVASREFDVARTVRPNLARLTIAGIPVRFELRHEREAGIDLYRIRSRAA